MQDLTEFLLCLGLCAEFAITASVVRNCLLGSAGISLQLVTYQECYKSYFSLSYLLDDFGRIKVHFSLLMRFSPAELFGQMSRKTSFCDLGYSVSSVWEGANSYTWLERGLVPQGSFVPIMIINPPTLFQTLFLCKT